MTNTKSKVVFLTGASGFIGRRVLAMLLSEGHSVIAPSRSAAGRRQLDKAGARSSSVSLSDQAGLQAALSACDTVVHLAYDVRSDATSNLNAFSNLLEAASESGIKSFVHMSSIVVFDDWPIGQIDANSPITLGGSQYRRAKIEMEQLAFKQTVPVSILEPTLVYGPGSSLWTDRFANALATGGVFLPKDAGKPALVHVDDVARAVLCAIRAEPKVTRRYPIDGGGTESWMSYLSGMGDIIGGAGVSIVALEALRNRAGPRIGGIKSTRPSRAAQISALARRVLGHQRFESIVDRVRRMSGRGKDPLYPDHALLDLYVTDSKISTDAAKTDLGWTPQVDLTSALDQMTPYLRKFSEKG